MFATISCIIVYALSVTTLPLAFAQSLQPQEAQGVTVATDNDCVVSIDDKIVGRVQKGRQELFRATAGTHALAAATTQGDYWEQKVDVGVGLAFSVSVSFEKVRSDQALLERNVSDLRKQVTEKQLELDRVRAKAAQIEATRRHSIVEAINYYTDRWGKEIGMRDDRNESSQSISDATEDQYFRNLGNPNQTAQGIGNVIILAEMLQADRLKKKALKNGIAAEAASLRMAYLGKALENPRQYPPDTDVEGYSAIVTNVTRKKMPGKLLLSPNRISYKDAKLTFNATCSGARGSSTRKVVHIAYVEERQGRNAVGDVATLHLIRRVQRPERSWAIYIWPVPT